MHAYSHTPYLHAYWHTSIHDVQQDDGSRACTQGCFCCLQKREKSMSCQQYMPYHKHRKVLHGSGECDNESKEPCQGSGDSVWWWSDNQRLQRGSTCLMSACEGGHLDVVKYVCEVGGKELVMAKRRVSGTVKASVNLQTHFMCLCVYAYTEIRVTVHSGTHR